MCTLFPVASHGITNYHSSMRVLKTTGIILLVCVLGFLSIGILFPEISYQTTVHVSRSPATVFSVLTDAGRMGDWIEGYVSMETIVEHDDQIGNEYRLTFVQNGDTLILDEEVTEFVENERFGLTLTHEIMVTESSITLTKTSEGTSIATTNLVRGSGMLWRSLFPLMKGTLETEQRRQYERLSQIIEISPTSLVGQWTGNDTSGAEHLFEFKSDGTADWMVSAGGQQFQLENIHTAYNTDVMPFTLDLTGFQDGPLNGKTLFGIVEFSGDYSMRFDADSGSGDDASVRPSAFSNSTVEYRKIR